MINQNLFLNSKYVEYPATEYSGNGINGNGFSGNGYSGNGYEGNGIIDSTSDMFFDSIDLEALIA